MSARVVPFLAAIFIIGAALIWLIADEPTPPQTNAIASPAQPEQKEAEKASVARLQEKAEPARPKQSPTATPRSQPSPVKKTPSKKNHPPGSHFDDDLLAELGYVPEDIQFIRTIWEAGRDEEKAQDERVGRTQWVSPRDRAAAIRATMRVDLGDDFYDAMLYATNQTNRAKIGNVMKTSPAAAAGMRISDVIVSYDGERIFEPDDATRLSESGEPGSRVEVWIRRDGKDIKLEVEGGPLGIRYFPKKEKITAK